MCLPINTFQLAQPVCGISPSLHTKSFLKKIHVSFLKEVEGAVSDSGGRDLNTLGHQPNRPGF